MKIVCLGSTAQDSIDAANASYARASSGSDRMLNAFNTAGGSTPLKQTTVATTQSPSFMDQVGAFFDKASGIFAKLDTPASTVPTVVYTAKSAPIPLPAIAGIGLVAFILYKAAK